jgi:hypothetical protein
MVQLSIFHIEGPAAKAACLGYNNSIGVAFGKFTSAVIVLGFTFNTYTGIFSQAHSIV